MSDVKNNDGLDLIFRKARTHNVWLDKPVEDGLLRQVYDLAKLGPTSANMCPMRIVFVKSQEAKERLKSALHAGNVDKTMAAPVTAIIGMEIHYRHAIMVNPQTHKVEPPNPSEYQPATLASVTPLKSAQSAQISRGVRRG